MTEPHWLVLLALAATATGTIGGLGGAVVLVPALVLGGVEPLHAAPLGLVATAAAVTAASPLQLARGLVHHRLGVTVEVAASSGALVGALASAQVPDQALRLLLVATAAAAGIIGLTRTEVLDRPAFELAAEPATEWPGTLAGAYHGPGGVVPYRARRLPWGLSAMLGAGVLAGMAGVGGGFIKTPVMREVMWIPVKVAAATSTFTVGITSATALLVFAGQGRLDLGQAAAVALGGLVGGALGSRVQDRLGPRALRAFLSLLLLGVAVALVLYR